MYVCFSVFVYVNYDFLLCFLLSLVAFQRVELHHIVCFIYFINYLLKHVVCFFLYMS